jgi:thiosulfate reductase / polysulfide reductase chain A
MGRPNDEEITKVKGLCFFCWNQCGVTALIDKKTGELVGMRGDADHPLSRGFICERCRIGWKEFYHHPNRLRWPLKRVGERGENKWQQISWDQALDEIAEKLSRLRKQYGAETLASTSGTARTCEWARIRFQNLFGTPNLIGPCHICAQNDITIEGAIFGWPPNCVVVEKSPCIMVWGRNPAQSSQIDWLRIVDAKKAGSKIISVNSTYNEVSAIADIALGLRPGTDAALALGMLNVIINEKLYDKAFVDNWCYGFQKLRERVQDYPPGKVAAICEVSKEKMVEAARIYATSKPAHLTGYLATDHIGLNTTYAILAKDALKAITGNLDVTGGNPLPGLYPKVVPEFDLELNERLPVEQRKKQLGADRFKLQSWPGFELINYHANRKGPYKAGIPASGTCFAHDPTVYRAMKGGKPYPVKAFITLSANPLVAMANTRLVYEALKSVELAVTQDYWMTPTAMLSDYVTPAASWLERPNLNTFFGMANVVIGGGVIMPPVVPNQFERKNDFEFWRGLGIRLGQEKDWPWETHQECISYQLKPLGYKSFEEFLEKQRYLVQFPEDKKYEKIDPESGEPIGFATPTGKVELYSTILEKLGYEPLPYYEEPAESPYRTPEVAEKYPLILSTGARVSPLYHSEHRQIKSIRRLHPDPLVEIHPLTAHRNGIGDGDWVYIETPRGKVKRKAVLTPVVPEKMVQTRQNNWWFPEKSGEEPVLFGIFDPGTDNLITDDEPDHCDPVCGSWPLRALLCKIYRAEEPR